MAILDEDKAFFGYEDVYEKILDYVMTRLKYVSVRVGGNSFRSAELLCARMKQCKYPSTRFIHLSCEDNDRNIKETSEEDIFRTIEMRKLSDSDDDELIQKAEELDTRGSNAAGEMKSMVWFYANNISTGWYNEDGSLSPFNDNIKGLWMITEIAKVRGFQAIKPATAAIFTNTELALKGPWKPRPGYSQTREKTLSERQEQLCIDMGIPYLDIASVIDKEWMRK